MTRSDCLEERHEIDSRFRKALVSLTVPARLGITEGTAVCQFPCRFLAFDPFTNVAFAGPPSCRAGPTGAAHAARSESAALQCGICSPGFVVAARHFLASNLCRCTGYDKIIRAALAAAEAKN